MNKNLDIATVDPLGTPVPHIVENSHILFVISRYRYIQKCPLGKPVPHVVENSHITFDSQEIINN